MSTADIRDAAMKLTPEERARLAEELLASLDAPDQGEIDAACGEEAERRIDALDAGKTTAIPADDVFRELEGRRQESKAVNQLSSKATTQAATAAQIR